MGSAGEIPTSELLARQRRRIRSAQWGILGAYALVGLLTLVLPFGREELRSRVLHVPYILALSAAAANIAWGTWLRFRMDGTSRAWLLSASFAVLALLYAPHAIYDAQESDPAGFFYGPASRLAFGVTMLIALTPLQIPRVLKHPRATFLLLVLLVVAVVDVVLHAEWVLDLLGPDPRESNRRIEAAAMVTQGIAVLWWLVKWMRLRRRIMITWLLGMLALTTSSALMLPTSGWELRWWVAHLGVLVAAVVFVLGTDQRMARAIDERELLLLYQPKVDLTTDRLIGVEALMRWQHPDHGLVAAGDFITKAEETDLITPFTYWAIREATRQHREWLDQGMRIPIAVNVSARLLRDAKLLELIKAELAAHGLGPEAINIELTESRALESEPQAGEMLAALAALGLWIAIDDFGTGYSSISYVRNLPVKEVKLDKSFVAQIANDENDYRVVKSTIELAQGLGHKVVAEGIEDAATRDLLVGLSCDVGQGYFWSRPLPASELAAWERDREPRPPLAPSPRAPAPGHAET